MRNVGCGSEAQIALCSPSFGRVSDGSLINPPINPMVRTPKRVLHVPDGQDQMAEVV